MAIELIGESESVMDVGRFVDHSIRGMHVKHWILQSRGWDVLNPQSPKSPNQFKHVKHLLVYEGQRPGGPTASPRTRIGETIGLNMGTGRECREMTIGVDWCRGLNQLEGKKGKNKIMGKNQFLPIHDREDSLLCSHSCTWFVFNVLNDFVICIWPPPPLPVFHSYLL
jgi:hypothetical protein